MILVIQGFANSSEVVSPGSGAGITWFGQIAGVIFRWAESYLGLSWKLSWVEQVNKLCLFHSTFEGGLTRLRITGISRHRYIHHHLVDRPTQLWCQPTNTKDTDISTTTFPDYHPAEEDDRATQPPFSWSPIISDKIFGDCQWAVGTYNEEVSRDGKYKEENTNTNTNTNTDTNSNTNPICTSVPRSRDGKSLLMSSC